MLDIRTKGFAEHIKLVHRYELHLPFGLMRGWLGSRKTTIYKSCIAYDVDNVPVGCAFVMDHGEGTEFVCFVKQRVRRQGIGRLMATELGAVNCTVYKHNDVARKFYNKMEREANSVIASRT